MKFSVLVLALISTSVAAAPTWHTSKVKSVYPLSDGGVVVTFVNDHPDCSNANNPKYYYLEVGVNRVSELGLKHMYSALLTAAASGKDVVINYDSASSGCHINRLSVRF